MWTCVVLLAAAGCAHKAHERSATAHGSNDGADDLAFAESRRELKLAITAYRATDRAGLLAHAERAVALQPDSVHALYTLACAQAVNGRAEPMRASLHRLAAMRVYFDLGADEDFAKVRTSPAYLAARDEMNALLAERVGAGDVAFTLRERDLLTEGLARDPKSGAFFVSSVRKRKIVRIAPDGTASDFVGEGQDGLWAVFALAVDVRRGLLVALTTPVPEMAGYDAKEAGASGVFEFDLATGKLRSKLVLLPPTANGGAGHSFNDLVLAPDGTAYIGDGRTGEIVTLAPGAVSVEPLVPAGRLTSAQGMVLSSDGRALYVADYARGLVRVDLATRAVRSLVGPRDVVLSGIDGLSADGTALIATQNGIRPHRILRLRLDAAGQRIETVDRLAINDPRLDEPTLGTVVGRDFFYIANAQWGHFSPKGPAMEDLREPTILKLSVEPR
jgi:sugar lactone lactonase YvrE